MRIERESFVIPVESPAEQMSEFHLEFNGPGGTENVVVTITGFQSLGTLMKALIVVGSHENVTQTYADIVGPQDECPLAVLDAIEALGRTGTERPGFQPPF
jgi:hypothetical protein